MESASRRYFYPLRNPDNSKDVTLVEITEEQYRALYPEIWRTQKQERKLRRCLCPASKLWKCDGDCLVCPYHAAGSIWSLDQELETLGAEKASLEASLSSGTLSYEEVEQASRRYAEVKALIDGKEMRWLELSLY